MIPISLKVRGVTVLKNIEIDFSKITGDIVAITGANGQGKTSLMESIFLGMYRMFPSRPEYIPIAMDGMLSLISNLIGMDRSSELS